jgi:uncharacterized protein
VVKVHQKVMVTVVDVDLPRKRIALSMKAKPELGPSTSGQRTSPGAPRPPGQRPPPRGNPAAPATDWFTAALNRAQRDKN